MTKTQILVGRSIAARPKVCHCWLRWVSPFSSPVHFHNKLLKLYLNLKILQMQSKRWKFRTKWKFYYRAVCAKYSRKSFITYIFDSDQQINWHWRYSRVANYEQIEWDWRMKVLFDRHRAQKTKKKQFTKRYSGFFVLVLSLTLVQNQLLNGYDECTRIGKLKRLVQRPSY